MIPKRLIYVRKLRKMKQREVAELAGIAGDNPSSTYSSYETGRTQPSYQRMMAIAKILDFPVSYFYTEEDYLADAILQLHQDRLSPVKNPYYAAVKEVEHLREELHEKDIVITRISDLIENLNRKKS